MNRFKKYSFLIFIIGILFFCSNVVLAGYNGNFFSEKDAAAFSLLAYQDEENQPSIPDGFALLCKCPLEFQNKDYYGEAYYRLEYGIYPDGHKTDKPVGVTVVIAHRGTILKTDNLSDDLLVALKMAPDSFFMSSKPFTDYVRSLVNSKFPYSDGFFTHTFIHTGHSLGAIHAELNFVFQKKDDRFGNIYATTFESPGSKEIIKSFILSNLLPSTSLCDIWSIEIVNTDINLINTANEQAYLPWRISPGYNFINIPKIDISPIDIKYFSTLFTLDQHNMAKIYNYFKNGGNLMASRDHSKEYVSNSACDAVSDYPVGIINAFKYYKIYDPEWHKEHRDYWNQAFKVYWDNHNEIHAEYGNNLDTYREYMIRHHLS